MCRRRKFEDITDRPDDGRLGCVHSSRGRQAVESVRRYYSGKRLFSSSVYWQANGIGRRRCSASHFPASLALHNAAGAAHGRLGETCKKINMHIRIHVKYMAVQAWWSMDVYIHNCRRPVLHRGLVVQAFCRKVHGTSGHK